VFFDFTSPFCRNLWAPLKRVGKEAGAKMAVVLSPLVPAEAAMSRKAAAGFSCLWRLGARSGLVEAILEVSAGTEEEGLSKVVARYGIPADRFAACVAAPETNEAILRSASLARKLGVKGAPAVFMNGRRVKPPAGLDYYSLFGAFNQSLAAAPRPVARPTPAR